MNKDQKRDRLREIVGEKSLLRGEHFALASGTTSTYYFNMKPTTFDPEGATLIADLILEALDPFDIQTVGGLEMGAVPIASCISLRSFEKNRPLQGFFVRKEAKEHGTQARIEPPLPPGTRVAIVEDVTTTGASALRAAEALRTNGCEVIVVVTLVDRLEGAASEFAKQKLPFIALFTADEFTLED